MTAEMLKKKDILRQVFFFFKKEAFVKVALRHAHKRAQACTLSPLLPVPLLSDGGSFLCATLTLPVYIKKKAASLRFTGWAADKTA